MTRPHVLIIGAGPAGMFAADSLADIADVVLVDKGRDIEDRVCPPGRMCECPTCMILEGTGGAGGLSDGKITLSLNRGTQKEELFDPSDAYLLDHIDDTVRLHAGDGIWYDPVGDSEVEEKFRSVGLEFGSYPLRHVGSDGIQKYVKGHLEDLRHRGVEILTGVDIDPLLDVDGDEIHALFHSDSSIWSITREFDYVLIAVGLSGAEWTEEAMSHLGVSSGAGPAGFGMRLEAPAHVLAPLFNSFYDFKIERDYEIGSIRSFCCNQQGEVVNERHRDLGIRNVNGHSYLDPNLRTEFSNFAMIMKLGQDPEWWEEMTDQTPQDYVRSLSYLINRGAGGSSAIQSVTSFLNPGKKTGIRGGYTNRKATPYSIVKALPPDIRDAYRDYLWRLSDVVPGLEETANVYAPEMKYYARKLPVAMGRWSLPNHPMNLDRVYVLGHATGYFDSYTASGITGLQAARDIKDREGRMNNG